MRNALSAVLMAGLTVSLIAAPPQERLGGEEIYERSAPYVVTIRTPNGSGTGFIVDVLPEKPYRVNWNSEFRASFVEKGLAPSGGSDASLDRLIQTKSFVVTAYHVVAGADEIKILSSGKGSFVPAVVYGFNAQDDIAILVTDSRIMKGGLTLADYSRTAIGTDIYVLGNPLGVLDNSISSGSLSAKRILNEIPVVQFSAPVSPGNSGGPIISSSGEVVGMVLAFITEGQSLNFGLATSRIKEALLRTSPLARASDLPLPVAEARASPVEQNTSPKANESLTLTMKRQKASVVFGYVMNLVWTEQLVWSINSQQEINSGGWSEYNAGSRFTRFASRVPSTLLELPSSVLTDALLVLPSNEIEELNDGLRLILDVARDLVSREGLAAISSRYRSTRREAQFQRDYKAFRTAQGRLSDAILALNNTVTSSDLYTYKDYNKQLDDALIFIFSRRSFLVIIDMEFKHQARVAGKDDRFEVGDVIVGIGSSKVSDRKSVQTWRDISDWLMSNKNLTSCYVVVRRNSAKKMIWVEIRRL